MALCSVLKYSNCPLEWEEEGQWYWRSQGNKGKIGKTESECGVGVLIHSCKQPLALFLLS